MDGSRGERRHDSGDSGGGKSGEADAEGSWDIVCKFMDCVSERGYECSDDAPEDDEASA